ncbi:hypothetical protein ACFZAM_31510 [Streptomyces sp. NPDC008079]|uniref:hypothetical protein n=1 Tax=Streptomyces sp. NPDC008079 TaxID=3364806 RepID=UPI0036ECD71D
MNAIFVFLTIFIVTEYIAGAAQEIWLNSSYLKGRNGFRKFVTGWTFVLIWPWIEPVNVIRGKSHHSAAQYTRLHRAMTDALRTISPKYSTDRIWGRLPGVSDDVGQPGNVWAADPEDIADIMIRVLKDDSRS